MTDRGSIDQGGSGSMGQTGSGSGGFGYDSPAWDVPKNQLAGQINDLDSFVIIGTKQGRPFVASTENKQQVQQLLKQHVSDLLPQNA